MKMKVALAALLLLASAMGASAKVYKLTFDGMCDGMELSVTGIHVVGTHVNNDCSGGSNVDGGFVGKLGTHKEFIVTDAQGTDLGAAVTYLIGPDGTWSVYYTLDGETQLLGADGTWTKGLPHPGHRPGGMPKSTRSAIHIAK